MGWYVKESLRNYGVARRPCTIWVYDYIQLGMPQKRVPWAPIARLEGSRLSFVVPAVN